MELAAPPALVASVPQITLPLASVSRASEHEEIVGTFKPPEITERPRRVDVPVVAPNWRASNPPANVDVAVVVATSEPTVT